MWYILNAVWNRSLHPIEAHQKISAIFGIEVIQLTRKQEGINVPDRFHTFKGEGDVCLTCGLRKFDHC